MNSTVKHFLASTIYPRLHIVRCGLLSELLTKERQDGRSCELVCPSCWNPDAIHYFGTGSITCNNCDAETDLCRALQEVTSVDEGEAISLLLRSVGVAPPSEIANLISSNEPARPSIVNASNSIRKIKTTYLDRKWLLKQLRTWMSVSNDSIDQLIQAGWTAELIDKAPIGFLAGSSELESMYIGKLPNMLYKSSQAVGEGIVVPWFVGKDDALLWGYTGSLLTSSPAYFPINRKINACHLHHPIQRRSKWTLVVEDPLLASLLIAKQIPTVAVGERDWWQFTLDSLSGMKKDVYVLDNKAETLFLEVKKVLTRAKKTKMISPLDFGPYHGAYYRRFTKWPHSRYTLKTVPKHSDREVIVELYRLLESGIPYSQARDEISKTTGKRVEIRDLRDGNVKPK